MEEVFPNNVVVRCLNIQADMFVGNQLNHRE